MNMDSEKMKLLMELVEEAKTKEKNEILPFFLALNSRAQKAGIYFSDEETEFILNQLKETMSKEDLKKIETIRRMSKILGKRQKK